MANRSGATPIDNVPTDRQYDEDFNQIGGEDNGPYTTYIYSGPTGEIPASIFEKLFRLISSHAHQALMLFHQMIQGISLYVFILRIKMYR